jgi:hypothetical protein
MNSATTFREKTLNLEHAALNLNAQQLNIECAAIEH